MNTQTARTIYTYLKTIKDHVKATEELFKTAKGCLTPPTGRRYTELASKITDLFIACDTLRSQLQKEQNDLAPPTHLEMIDAVQANMKFENQQDDLNNNITGSLTIKSSLPINQHHLNNQFEIQHIQRQLAWEISKSFNQETLTKMANKHPNNKIIE